MICLSKSDDRPGLPSLALQPPPLAQQWSHAQMKLSQTRIAIILAVLVASTSGCGVINRIRAKNELNEAARTYRESHFDEAEQHSRRALELDPGNKTAPLFIA